MAITPAQPTANSLVKSVSSSRTRRRQHRRFNLALLGFLSAPLVVAAGFNTVVDPYGVHGRDGWVGFNHVKPRQGNSDRLNKAIAVINQQPDVVILGSSRVKQGINPDHPQLQARGERVYNLGLNGLNSYEQLRYFEHLLANQPQPRLIVVGLDFFMYNQHLENQAGYEEYRLERRQMAWQDWINVNLSLDALQASYDTIIASRQDAGESPPNYGHNGFMPNLNAEDGKTEWRFAQSLQLYYRRHGDYELSAEHVGHFANLVTIARDRGIPIVAFFSPTHVIHWEGIRLTGRWEAYESWKRQMVAILPVWDFMGYDQFSAEPVAAVMRHYTDESHYRVSVGDRILDRILASNGADGPGGFGVLLTPETVDEYLADVRRDREVWAASNPEVLAWVAEQRVIQLRADGEQGD